MTTSTAGQSCAAGAARLGDNIAESIVASAGVDPAQVKRILSSVEAAAADTAVIVKSVRSVIEPVASFLQSLFSQKS